MNPTWIACATLAVVLLVAGAVAHAPGLLILALLCGLAAVFFVDAR